MHKSIMVAQTQKDTYMHKSVGHTVSLKFFTNILAYSKKFIDATGKYECKKWKVDEASKVIFLLSTEYESGDCLFKMISCMVSLIVFCTSYQFVNFIPG